MHTLYDPRQNHILAAMSTLDCNQLFQHLELVPMPLGHVLRESGCQLHYVYFPTTAIISCHYVMGNGASAEFSVVGNEGVVGVSLFMGGGTTTSRSVVHGAGYAYRLKRKIILDEFYRSGPMQHLLLRYTQSLLTQIAQTSACNRHHSLDQQLCRCLLMRLDRAASTELVLTQDLIASAIGVRREGITDAAGKLQKAGLIEYRRGHITVLDRAGLEARACECYAVVRKETTRLLGEVGAWEPTPHIVETALVKRRLRGNQLVVAAMTALP